MSKNKWQCEVCIDSFSLKRDLVEHLKEEVWANQENVDIAYDQIKELGADL